MMRKILIGIGIGVAAILVAFASGYATWYILSQTSSSPDEQTTDVASTTTQLATLQRALQSNEAVSSYILSEPMDAYSGAYVYVSDGASGSELAGLQPEKMLTMTPSSGSAFDEESLNAAQQAIIGALRSQGFTQLDGLPQLPELLGSFKSNELSCSLLGSSGAQSVALVCATTTNVAEASETLATLNNLQAGSSPDSPISTLDIAYDESRNGVAIVKSITSEGAQTAARVFTYDGSTWTYVDDALAGLAGDTQGGKIALTPALEALMNDATFRPLYTSLLGMDRE